MMIFNQIYWVSMGSFLGMEIHFVLVKV